MLSIIGYLKCSSVEEPGTKKLIDILILCENRVFRSGLIAITNTRFFKNILFWELPSVVHIIKSLQYTSILKSHSSNELYLLICTRWNQQQRLIRHSKDC